MTPGVDRARITFRSSGISARQYSGRLKSIERAPTLTGQDRLATLPPLLWTASHRVPTLMSCVYQYQPPMFFCSGSKVGLLAMPCLAGHTPVINVVWLG